MRLIAADWQPKSPIAPAPSGRWRIRSASASTGTTGRAGSPTSASSGSTMASTSRTTRPPISTMASRVRAALMVPLAVVTVALYSLRDGRSPNRAADFSFSAIIEAPVSTMKPMRWPSIRPSVWKWPRASRGMLRLREPAGATVSTAAAFRGTVLASARRHLVRHLRHQGAEADHEGGEDHHVTHDATLDPRTADITTSAAKPRLTGRRKVAILTKRMSEVLTASTGYAG